MSYRLIDFEMWQKPWFDGLSPKAKLLFIYLVTSPHNDKCGTQPLARGLMSYHCGLTPVELDLILVELSEKVSVVDNRIFANKFLKHQCRTGNFKSGIPNALKLLSEAVREKLLLVCGLTEVELGLNPTPTPVKPEINRPTTAPIVTSNKEQGTSSKDKRLSFSEAFSKFWEAYPRKEGKSSAFKCWNARIKEGGKPEDIILAATKYAKKCQNEGRETKFIKQPATFLNKDWAENLSIPDGGIQRNEMGQVTILNGLVY